MKTLKKLMLTAFTTVVSLSVAAQDNSGLVLHYDFSTVNGTSVSDVSGSGVTAQLKNSAKVEEMGKYKVLNLGTSNGYLDMTSSAGTVIQGLDNFTVSAYYRVNKSASLSGNGYFLWAFSTSTACDATNGLYSAYRLNAQRMATTTGGYQNEKAISIGSASAKDAWVHVAYTQSGTEGKLYVNGTQVGSVTNIPKLSTVFEGTAPSYCWLGRAPFSGDNYLKQTLVYDFRVYNKAIEATEVAALAAEAEDLENEYRYGTTGDFTNLQTAVENAENYVATNRALYPASAVAEYQDAIEVAKDVLVEKKLNQELIDEYVTMLTAAKQKLIATRGFVFDTSGITEGYSTDRGFLHPGGMHTEADFERIRQQLKDGNPTVTEAYNKLKAAEYSQAGVATYPVETIVRGGSGGQNYINAARGATMAYQNALRWKIEGTKANADAAVRILMAWAHTCKVVSGDSNWALAAGLYGYAFAQAAELMRDYEGWSRSDFETFKQWMLTVWYPGNINFLRGRNGTWENYVGNQGGIRPGHYWSNWPLCNALAVLSIGILCDDVFIYNQGMSFMKYDQVGTFQDPRTANPILSDGCTEFIGNLVVTTSESALETGAYGKLGQMQESGRDGGHAAMALGLAVDICKVAWNQGDDLFSYMDNRMAAGIEFVAACTQNVQGLPWTNYKYVDCRTAWHNGWLMTGPAEPAEVRNYWGTVIGHYEGVKGVKMPFAEKAYTQMGIDVGGTGGTSGAYDHLGYSVLMNTRDVQLCPEDQRPTLLSPQMTYNGKTVAHNELGGLKNTYVTTPVAERGLAVGTVVTLSPQLPDGATDTGNWRWNTGETTREISVTANRSYNYRVEYTNENGVKSYQNFVLAVDGDCEGTTITPSITYNGKTLSGQTDIDVMYGESVTLSLSGKTGWGYTTWDNGQTTESITLPQVTSDRTLQAYYENQGGRKSQLVSFNIHVIDMRPNIILNGTTLTDTLSVVVNAGDDVVLAPQVPSTRAYGSWNWDTGSRRSSLTLNDIESSAFHSVTYLFNGNTTRYDYRIYVKEAKDRLVDVGYYTIRHRESGRYLTREGDLTVLDSEKLRAVDDKPDDTQVWYLDRASAATYDLISAVDNAYMKRIGGVQARKAYRPHRIMFAAGTDYCQFYNKVTSGTYYWAVGADGALQFESTSQLENYPFELIRVSDYIPTGIESVELGGENLGTESSSAGDGEIYDLTGRRLSSLPDKGFYIKNGKKYLKK